MDFQLITTFDEMDLLAGEWNALLDECASHVPFLRHEYQRAWWQTLGGGEWHDAELRVVTARVDGKLAGVAPLFLSREREGGPTLFLIGSIEVSDYLDVLAAPEQTPAFIEGLLDFLAARTDWQILDLYNLLDSSPTLPLLESAALARGWRFECSRLQHSPYIPLPGDWEAYLETVDKKQRHEIKRKMRRLEESGEAFRWYTTTDEAALEQDIQDFMRLMANDPQKEAFLTPPMRAHMANVMRCAFKAQCLHLAFLEINGSKAAAYLSFDYLQRLWVYNSGLDRNYNAFSPGWVLLGHLLRWANEQGYREFDFMRGDEEYKYRFGAVDRFVERATLWRDKSISSANPTP